MALTKLPRASGSASPRGSNACRVRKKPVRVKPSARSSADWRRPGGAEEGRQAQQLVLPGLAGGARHRAPAAWRDIDQIVGRAGRRAAARSRPKPSSASSCSSKRTISGPARRASIRQPSTASSAAWMSRVRIALGQQPAERGEMGHAIDRVRRRRTGSPPQIEPFDRVMAEMLVEPRPPGGADPVARLQHRPQREPPRRAPGRDGGRARASSARRWHSPPRGA